MAGKYAINREKLYELVSRPTLAYWPERGELAMTFVYCLLAGFLGAVSAVAVLLLLFWVVVTQTDSEDETQSKERRLSPELEERR